MGPVGVDLGEKGRPGERDDRRMPSKGLGPRRETKRGRPSRGGGTGGGGDWGGWGLGEREMGNRVAWS